MWNQKSKLSMRRIQRLPKWIKTREFICANPECKKEVVMYSHVLGGGGSWIRNNKFKQHRKYCCDHCRELINSRNHEARVKAAKAEA
jgi:acetone carboxylase gamma subunit